MLYKTFLVFINEFNAPLILNQKKSIMKNIHHTTTSTFQDNHTLVIGEHIVQLMVAEYKKLFIKGMTYNDFINRVYYGIDEKKRTREGIALFKRVYSYLSSIHNDNRDTSENNKFIEYETTQ